jgi:hypothetical protein
MGPGAKHYTGIDEERDCWAVFDPAGRIVATKLDADTAEILCDAYNGSAHAALQVADVERAFAA